MLTKIKSWCGYVNIIEIRSKAKRMINDKRDNNKWNNSTGRYKNYKLMYT